MLGIVCFIWFLTLVKVNGNSDRKVNLALETVIKFDQPSLRSDVSFLDNMQSFLYKIKGAINEPDDDEISRRQNQKTPKEKHLVDYLEKAITIVLTYDDEDVKSLAKILNEEIRKYHYKGCKFYELANDKMFRKVMRQLLDELEKAPASVIRFQLNNALNSLRNTNELDKKLIDFVNSLYSKNSKQKLSRMINNLQFYKIRTRADNGNRDGTLHKVVGDAMKDLVFDHYSSLNDNARRALKVHINAYLVDLFKPNRQNIARSEPKRNFAHLIGYEEISKLFRMPTSPEKEKTILRRGDTKVRVTKGLMESRTMFKEKSYDPSSQERDLKEDDSSTAASSDSLNEDTETETTVKPTKTTVMEEKPKKKVKKIKTTTLKKNKAKRFHTQKNSDAMRTIWEEVQTVPPQSPPKPLKRTHPKERIIFEEHNAVINIGSWRSGLRDSSSEKGTLRAGDVKFDIQSLDKTDHHNDKSTDATDDEGMTLEFEGKSKSDKNTTRSLRKHIYSVDMKQLRAIKDSDDTSGDSTDSSDTESTKKDKEKEKPQVKKLSDDDDSKDSYPEIDSDNKFTAVPEVARAEDDDWNARKLMVKKNKFSSDEKQPDMTTEPKFMKISTLSLSDEEDTLTPSKKPKEKTSEENLKDNENKQASEDLEEIKRRENDNDDFEMAKPISEAKKTSEESTTTKNVTTSDKIEEEEIDKISNVEVTKKEHLEEDDALETTFTEVSSSYTTPSIFTSDRVTTTNQSSDTASQDETSPKTAKETSKMTAEIEADDTNLVDDVTTTTDAKTANNDSNTQIRFDAKKNTTEELIKVHDEKLTDLVKALDEAGEKARRHLGSSENEVKDKAFVMPWEDNEPL